MSGPEYQAYLRRHYRRRVIPASCGSGFAAGFALTDLWSYSSSGNAVLNPYIALIVLLAAIVVGTVALAATWTILGALESAP